MAASAGSRPSRVNPFAVEVMREAGIDLGTHRARASMSMLAAAEAELVA